ncbi:uncharacterized protein At2g29880-like [Henckelia pumila]|uniref:uncharacterized protein At2g29880-like n=1 Tax=Henckelia pumila TaxID=405737 RepID=UPI003C6E0BA6
MGDSQAKYNVWTAEESNELLKIMVDAAMRGCRDKNGVFNKKIVETKILPALNDKLGCGKNITQYQSRLKWYKQRYTSYCKLMRHNSGFGWDPVTKKFTANDESCPKHEYYRTNTFENYEDLRIVVGNGTATGKYSTESGGDNDARTVEIEEHRRTSLLDDYVYDHNIGEYFVQGDRQESSYQPAFLEDSVSPLPSHPISLDVPPTAKKRDRTDFEAKSTTCKSINPNTMREFSHSLEKVLSKIKSIGNAGGTCLEAIKEVPNLDNRARYKALDLLNTRSKKMDFLKMTIEERSGWIEYKLKG